MTYEAYKVLHFIGIFSIVSSLGASIMLALHTGSKNFPSRKMIAATHGIGMLVALVAGFGLIARLQVPLNPPPTWIIGKLAVWLAMGAAPGIVYRKPEMGKTWWVVVLVLATISAYLARYKPL